MNSEIRHLSLFLIFLFFNFYLFGQNIVGSTVSQALVENTPLNITGGMGIQTYDSYKQEKVIEEEESISAASNIMIAYPNPSNDFIEFSTLKNNLETLNYGYNVQIFNLSGVLIRRLEKVSDRYPIDVSFLANGIYLLEVNELKTDKKKAFKFLKRNK